MGIARRALLASDFPRFECFTGEHTRVVRFTSCFTRLAPETREPPFSEQSKAHQTRPEQSRAEQSRAEQNRAMPFV
uniref:Uncharacterized protein n=1 Tax=Vespula pensylvanica TaxID=30213 RepID=A0A834NAB4_VESPE|nr:hypothetical protein H0235_015835 [Vespula pensylvanica]